MMPRAPEFWTKDGALARLLAPLGRVYDIGVGHRLASRQGHACGLPVICVGNLVLGGAGKTPTAIALAQRLSALGRVPHILSKGYGGRAVAPTRVDPLRHGAAEVGDEPLLLARTAPVWVGRDRVDLARAATAAGADCLILDDGFQDPALIKTATLLVFDGGYGVGNGRVVPAGPLRETPQRGLARADACLIIGADQTGLATGLLAGRPCFSAHLAAQPGPELLQAPLLAFAGIGRPEKFFASLEGIGAILAGRRAFPDHHPYTDAQMQALARDAERIGARLVTTEKDAMRLSSEWRGRVAVLPVALQFADQGGIDHWLNGVLGRGG